MSAKRWTLALALLLSTTAVGTAETEMPLAEPPFRPMPPASAEPVDPPAPTVALRVRVPAVSAPGAELQYRIIVENTSSAPAHHVLVRNPLPANVQFVRAAPDPTDKIPELRWKLGTLEPSARKEIVLVVKPTGTGDVRNCARVTYEHGQCVTTRIGDTPAPTQTTTPVPTPAPAPVVTPRPVAEAKAELRLRLIGPPQAIVEVGPVIDFRTEVTNVGTAVAKGVVVTNKLPAGLDYSTSTPSVTGDQMGLVTWNLGDLAPGQTRRIVCTVIPKVTGAYTNRAEARDAAGHNWESSSSVVVGEPKLSVVTSGPKIRMVNRPASYQITISNPGSMPVTNVIVTSEVTEGMTLVNASAGGFYRKEPQKRFDKLLNRDVSYQEVRWSLGTLAAGERKALQMVLQTANPGKLDHRVTATADRNLEQHSEVQTEFEEATGITLEIEKSADPIPVGGKMTYKIRVINQGDGAAKNVGLTVLVPEQMAILKPTTGVIGQKVTFGPLVALAKKSTSEFLLDVEALKPGEVRLRVELTSDHLTAGGPIKADESTTIYGDAPTK